MTRNILPGVPLALLVLTAATTASAQSVGVHATAVIVTPITAEATAPLAFGTIAKGSTSTVLATSASAAAVTLSGDEGDNIVITVPASLTISTLAGSGATMNVSIGRNALRANTNNAQANATQLDASSGTATLALSADHQGNAINSDGLGQAYVWIGGSVTPGAMQQRGTYSGTFTVSAAYSN